MSKPYILADKPFMSRIVRITGTSAKCIFHFEDGSIIEASSEFIANKEGRFIGQTVYTSSLRHAQTKKPLNPIEIRQLMMAYWDYARTASGGFTLEFVEGGIPAGEMPSLEQAEADGRAPIKSGETPPRLGLPGVKYTLYRLADGTIQGETDLTIFPVADTLAAYQQMPAEELNHLIDTADRTPEHSGQYPFDIQPTGGREKAVLIKRGELTTLFEGMSYHVYQEVDGKVYGETAGAFFPIADSLEDYMQIPLEKLESTIYGAEMGASRGR